MLCDWLEEMLDFWFPSPVEVDMDGAVEDDKPRDIPQNPIDWDAGFSLKIPGRFRSSRRLPVLEPDDTPEMADTYVRYLGSRR